MCTIWCLNFMKDIEVNLCISEMKRGDTEHWIYIEY